jgi:hypothetical protein
VAVTVCEICHILKVWPWGDTKVEVLRRRTYHLSGRGPERAQDVLSEDVRAARGVDAHCESGPRAAVAIRKRGVWMGVRQPSSCAGHQFHSLPAFPPAGQVLSVPFFAETDRPLGLEPPGGVGTPAMGPRQQLAPHLLHPRFLTSFARHEFAWTSRSPSSAFPLREREVLFLIEVTYAAN